MASQTTTKKNNGQISHFFALVSKMDHIKKKQDRRYSDPKARNGLKIKKNKIHQKNLWKKI